MYIGTRGHGAAYDLPGLPSLDDTEQFRKLKKYSSDEICREQKKPARYNVTTLEMLMLRHWNHAGDCRVIKDTHDVIMK